MKNIKFKLLVPTLMMVVLALAGTAYISYLQYEAFQNQEKETTSKHTLRLINLLQSRRQKNIELIHLLSNRKHFIRSLLLKDRNTLLDEVMPYFEQMEYGFVNLYDLKGSIIVRADVPDMSGAQDELSSVVLQSLEKRETESTVSVYNGLLAIYSVQVLTVASRPIGVLVVGNYLDQPSVDNIARTNNLDIKFYLDDEEIVSSSKYNRVIDPGSERDTLVDVSEAGGGRISLKALLIEDIAAAKKKFWTRLFNIMLVMATVSTGIILFSRKTIMSAADSLNSARISAEQKTVALRSVNQKLNRVIKERRRIEDELQEARDRAMEASNAKSLFLANMSHEIRTPMNSIIGFTQLLEKTPVNKTQREYLNIIGGSAETLLDIINSILDFSKIESGKFELETAGFDIFEEIEGVIETLSFKANEKSIDLMLLLDPMLPRFLLGDPLRIKQVLTNLVGNAIKFTDRGGYVYVRILRDGVDENTGNVYISFSVEDNGIGIPKEKQESILEPFTQADFSISRQYGGTGLGLAISDNIVKMMGGTLSLDSEPGKGTRFSFILKLRMPVGNNDKAAKRINAGLKVAICGSGRTGPSQEKVIGTYLEYIGCSVHITDDIADLLDIGDIDVVVMLIPPIDGDAIKTVRVITSAPIIAVAREYAAEIMEGSFDKVIYQPVYMSKLVDAVGDVTGSETLPSEKSMLPVPETAKLNARVLVAEDVPTNQMLIKLILGELGIDVDIASNGLEAVEKYRTGIYDAVFMDIHMPVCNGNSATKMIREYEQRTSKRRIPVIALTADAIKGEKERLLADGMDDYITKPIDRAALNSVLRKYIGGSTAEKHDAEESRKCYFDIEAVAGSLGITREMAWFCMQDFLSSLDEDLKEFRGHVDAGNRSGIREIAHKIKGTAANLRMEEIADICREVEGIVKSALTADSLVDLKDALDRLSELRDRFRAMEGLS